MNYKNPHKTITYIKILEALNNKLSRYTRTYKTSWLARVIDESVPAPHNFDYEKLDCT